MSSINHELELLMDFLYERVLFIRFEIFLFVKVLSSGYNERLGLTSKITLLPILPLVTFNIKILNLIAPRYS